MTIEQAAKALHEEYRDAHWLTAVGVGEHEGRACIVVYVKSLDPARVGSFESGWYGFPVVVRKMSPPRLVLSP